MTGDDDGDERALALAQSVATVERLRDLRPRSHLEITMAQPEDPLRQWRADGERRERERRQARLQMRQEERRLRQEQEAIQRKAGNMAVDWNEIDRHIDSRVAAAIKAERKRGRDVLSEVLAEVQATIGKRFDVTIASLEDARRELRKLNADKADGNGIHRRQYYTTPQ
jgi:hypothetical protein